MILFIKKWAWHSKWALPKFWVLSNRSKYMISNWDRAIALLFVKGDDIWVILIIYYRNIKIFSLAHGSDAGLVWEEKIYESMRQTKYFSGNIFIGTV